MSYFIRVTNPNTPPPVPQYWEQQIISGSQSNIFYNDGYVGLGIPNPLSRLSIDGGISIGSSYYDKAIPNGVLAITNNIGIGTTNPQAELDVGTGTIRAGDGGFQINNNGTILLNSGVGLPRQTNITFLGGNGNTTGNIIFKPYGNNEHYSIQLQEQNTCTNTQFSIYSDKAGVGTIWNTYGDNGNTTFFKNVDFQGTVNMLSNLTVYGTQTIINTETQVTDQLIINNAGTGSALIVNQTGAEPIVEFKDDGNTVFKIINEGNVGIGTITPVNKLDVNGNIQMNKLKFNSIPLSNPSEGHIEYDGLFEGSTSNNWRGLIPIIPHYTPTTSKTFANVTTAQSIFANNINLNGSTTYYFKMVVHKIRTASAGTANSPTLSLSFTGTATVTSISYTAIVARATTSTTPQGTTSKRNATTASSIIGVALSSLNEYTDILVEGIVRTGTGGTFIPNLIYSAAVSSPTAYTDAIQSNSFIKYYPIGIDTVLFTGDTWV